MKVRLSVISFLFCSLLSSVQADDDLSYFKNLQDQLNTGKGIETHVSKSDYEFDKNIKEKAKQYISSNMDLVDSVKKTEKRVLDIAANDKDTIFSNKTVKELELSGKKYRDSMQKEINLDKQIVDTYDTLIFISFGMSEETIKQLYLINAGNERTALILRGLIKGDNEIPQTIRKIQKVASDLKLKTPPTVLINPVWFKEYNITSVPTIVVLKGKTPKKSGDIETGKTITGPKQIARVQGLIDPQTVYQAIYEGKSGDLGVQGPIEEIEERDLIEEMQERASKIDWEKKKQQAYKRAWKNIPITQLDHATEDRVRVIDPTVTVKEDIIVDNPHQKGEKLVLAKRGDKINPLQLRVFDRILVVFDPTDKKELEYVKNNYTRWIEERATAPYTVVKLLITSIDRDNGWEEIGKLSDSFNEPIYTLMPEIKTTFMLEKTPCVVYAEGTNFIVEEFDVNKKAEKKNTNEK